MAHPIAIVAEDRLTEAVLQKCIATYLPDFKIIRSEVKGGRGNVKKLLPAYAALAAKLPVVVGVDLDGDECAPSLLAAWSAVYESHENLHVRIAVREVESWVLADRKRVATLIGSQSDDISKAPDLLDDPKGFFLALARANANQELRRDLVPRNFDNQYPRIGPAYNLQMCSFVLNKWRPHVALKRSKSLERAINAIRSLG